MHISINIKNLISVIGMLLLVLGLAVIPSFLVAIYYQEQPSSITLFATAAICLISGLLILKVFPLSNIKIKAREGFLMVALSWIIASFISALPFYFTGSIPKLVDAFFEMCSGYSTTGATILTDIEALPKSMLFWRSFTHWLGGMGIIVFATAILPSIGVEGMLIASNETPGPTLDKMTPKFSDTAKKLYQLYFGMTVVLVILLLLGGMSPYDAMVHSFGTMGTGGFSSHGDSIAYFKSPYIYWVITIFMILCGINFNLYFVMKHSFKRAFQDEELRAYLIIIVAFTALISLALMASGKYNNLFDCVTDSAFQVAAIITTTGYCTTDFDLWPSFTKMLLLIIMFTGACSSSTGGGAKIVRIIVSAKLIKRDLYLRIHPNQVTDLRLNNNPLPQEVTTNITNFMFLYFTTILAGSCIVALNGFDLVTTFTSVLTCISNVGPGLNKVGPTVNFSIFNDFNTLVLSFLMIAGRLELFTFLMLFSRHYWNPNKV